MKLGLLLALLLLPLMPACSEKCPPVDCVPSVTATFTHPIAAAYRLAVVVNVASFAANCPMAAIDLGRTPGIRSCDDHQFVVTGVDLGHEDNVFVGLTVTINSGIQLSTGAELRGIANSRDCDLVCYAHTAIIPN